MADKRHEGMTEEEVRAWKDARNERDRKRRAERAAARKNLYKPKDPGLSDKQKASMDKRQLYLNRLSVGRTRSQSAEDAGVHYDTVKYWRKTDSAFAEKEHEVLESMVDHVEDALIAQIQSDYASIGDKLKFLEKARPEKWGNKSRVEHEHTLSYDGSVEERLARLRGLMQAQGRDASVLDAYVVSDEPVAELPAASDG